MQTIEKNPKKYAVSDWAEVWECSTSKSKSLHTKVDFLDGQFIADFGAKETLDRPNYLTVQIGDRQHIMLDPEFFQYINHSCDPNVFFDTEKKVLVAIKPIKVGEQLTFFYPSTEWSMDRGFDCLCGSDRCLKVIRGAAHLTPDILDTYKLSQYIQRQLEIESKTHN